MTYIKENKVKTFLYTLITLLAIGLTSFYTKDETEQSILNKKLQYSQSLGWINWGHARPEGTREALRQFENSFKADLGSFCYSQTMKSQYFGQVFVAKVEKCICIENNTKIKDRANTFLQLFVSVSDAFETFQSEGICNILPTVRSSSFREGDLMGNLISYYSTITEKELETIQEDLALLSPSQSLILYKERGLRKTNWKDLEVNYDTTNSTLKDLDKLLEDIKSEHLGSINSEKKVIRYHLE